MTKNVHDQASEMQELFAILSKKWALMVLHTLLRVGEARYSDFEEHIPEINSRALSQRLSDLEKGGFIKRVVGKSKPVQVHYELTDKARDLHKMFHCMTHCCEKWKGKKC